MKTFISRRLGYNIVCVIIPKNHFYHGMQTFNGLDLNTNDFDFFQAGEVKKTDVEEYEEYLTKRDFGSWLLDIRTDRNISDVRIADFLNELVSCLCEEVPNTSVAEEPSDTLVETIVTQEIYTTIMTVGPWKFISSKLGTGRLPVHNIISILDGKTMLNEYPETVKVKKGYVDVRKSIHTGHIVFRDNDLVLSYAGFYTNNAENYSGIAYAVIPKKEGVVQSYKYHLKVELAHYVDAYHIVKAEFEDGVLITQSIYE